jgi:GT2 family glycosyltransferase
MNPKLSIIVLNFNSGQLLRECLDSVFEHPPSCTFEVIVPDNASSDTSLRVAEQAWGDRIRVVHNGGNRGFSWGNNRGIEVARGEYVCLLNPDTVVHENTLTRLVAFMDSHPRAACCGPKVLNPDGTFQLSAIRAIPTPFDAISRALLLSRAFPNSRRLARYNMTYVDTARTQQVDASTGCCMFMRRTALDEIGMLDEGYFLYCEDVDWFVRAKRAGWEVWYVADVTLEHHHAYSEKFRRREAVYNFHDSMIRFHRKHYAERYPSIANAMIYGAVRARMHWITAYRSLQGWS